MKRPLRYLFLWGSIDGTRNWLREIASFWKRVRPWQKPKNMRWSIRLLLLDLFFHLISQNWKNSRCRFFACSPAEKQGILLGWDWCHQKNFYGLKSVPQVEKIISKAKISLETGYNGDGCLQIVRLIRLNNGKTMENHGNGLALQHRSVCMTMTKHCAIEFGFRLLNLCLKVLD